MSDVHDPGQASAEAVTHDPASASPSSGTLLVAAITVAAILRIGWAMRHGLSLEQEGLEYTRIAENLLAGRGYVGMFNNGPQLNFPPLYPILIAAVSLILPSAEIAARAVCIIFGSVLVIPAFRIAEQIYGRRVAIAVAVLVVFHPVLIAMSGSSYAEGPYLTLLLFGLLWLARWVATLRVQASLLAGVFFGLAYLIRPEAFVLVGGFTTLAVIIGFFASRRRAILLGALALPVTFAVVAAPNVIYLSKATGRFRIEAKGTLAYAWGSRINAGMPYVEAVKGIGEDLSDQGVFMRPNLEVINSTSYTKRQYLAFVLHAVKRNIAPIHRIVVDEKAFGSPFLFALVVLAVFRSGWTRQRILLDGLLLVTAATVLAILGTVQELWFRYFYSVLGIFLIWGGKGVCDLEEWGRTTAAALTENPRITRLAGQLTALAAMAAVLGVAWKTIPEVSQFHESSWPERATAGRWLAAQAPAQKRVMDSGMQVAYYAGADMTYLPYSRSELAIRYVAKQRPDFIVLHSATKADLPYTTQWFDEGVPDKRAVLIYDHGSPAHDHIKIYRWVDPAPTP